MKPAFLRTLSPVLRYRAITQTRVQRDRQGDLTAHSGSSHLRERALRLLFRHAIQCGVLELSAHLEAAMKRTWFWNLVQKKL